ncbi:MAG: hypothetical protein ACFFE8_02150 [Candidatus Heimdallarchaeota archaeon]
MMKLLKFLLTILVLSTSTHVLVISDIVVIPFTNDSEPESTFFIEKSGNRFSTKTLPGNESFLPRTNLTVNRYSRGIFETQYTFEGNYNVTVLKLNKTHWDTKCEYPLSLDANNDPFVSPFLTSVNRTSLDHFYNASNYYDWTFGLAQDTFDFWINTSGFYDGYLFKWGGINLTVYDGGIATIPNVGAFNTWILEAELSPPSWINITYSSYGLFLNLNMSYISLFYYNLTYAAFGELPTGYTGPSMTLSPKNGSVLPSGTILVPIISSPYGISEAYYQWDDGANTSVLLPLPSENTFHDLFITAVDGLGLKNAYYYRYLTDDSVPGVILNNPVNGSRIKGSDTINVSFTTSNGSFLYSWNGTQNVTLTDGEVVPVFSPLIEGIRILEVFVINPAEDVWTRARYVFFIDNTKPILNIHGFVNGSVIKGTLNLTVSMSEDGKISYLLEPFKIVSFSTTENSNHSILLPNLSNGTYRLILYGTDEANNTAQKLIIFSIYTSAFEWTWKLEAYKPKRLVVVDATGSPWFILTLTSSVYQEFNLTKTVDESFPVLSPSHAFIVKFVCSNPTELLFITLEYSIESAENTSTFPVHEWEAWNDADQKWAEVHTNYNEIHHSWEATIEGYVTFFALRETGRTTRLREVTPGGGQISGFEFLFGLMGLVIMLRPFSRKMARKNKKESS